MINRHMLLIIAVSILTGCMNNSIFRDNFAAECQFRDAAHNGDRLYREPPVCSYNQKDYHTDFGYCKPRNRPNYRPPNPYHADCMNHALQKYTSPRQNQDYHLAFIEYDDQGQLHQREQLFRVRQYVKGLTDENQVILVVYVHGWHHTAGYNNDKNDDDTDIQKFRVLLRQLAQSEFNRITKNAEENKPESRKVVGVYIGWRGETTNVPGFSELTFWGRKNVAHRIGHLGISETLLELEKIVDPDRASATPEKADKKHYMIILGHSLGAAVVASGLQNTLVDRHLLAQNQYKYSANPKMNIPVKGFGDLTVLVNPAFEAVRFATLYDVAQNYHEGIGCIPYPRNQPPRVAVLTGIGDLPTGVAFPLGRRVETLLETHRDYERNWCAYDENSTARYINVRTTIAQDKANVTALGHFEPFLTHRLKSRKDSLLRASIERGQILKTAWRKQHNKSRLCFEHVALEHIGNSDPLNPYLNIQVEKDIMSDHNDFWGIKLQSFIQALIRIATTRDTGGKLDNYDENCELIPDDIDQPLIVSGGD